MLPLVINGNSWRIARRPLFPRKRTSAERIEMSVRGQKQTSACLMTPLNEKPRTMPGPLRSSARGSVPAVARAAEVIVHADANDIAGELGG